jgi:uncharacterized cupredoxin-like copper-binding protein
MSRIPLGAAVAAIALAVSGAAFGHGDEPAHPKATAHDHSSAEKTAFGEPADPKAAKRTVTVDMADAMRFTPSHIEVKRGESVRFIAKNDGKVVHELVLGTHNDLEEHAALMRKFPGMEHDEPNMVRVAPGKTGEVSWRFTRPGEFYYGCLEPGHFEAGMVGKVTVR